MLRSSTLILIILLGFLMGCSGGGGRGTILEVEESQYQKGFRYLQQGLKSEALGAFLKLTEERPDAAESHLEAGRLYLDHMDDPVSAIYHFRKYLEIKPNSVEAPMVSQLIDTAKKSFIRQIPAFPYEEQSMERIDWVQLLKQVRDENVRLKRKVALLERRYGTLEANTQANVPDVIPLNVHVQGQKGATSYRKYVVQGGDTLSRISIKLYGDANHWEGIFQANRDLLNSPHDLREGQELNIPN